MAKALMIAAIAMLCFVCHSHFIPSHSPPSATYPPHSHFIPSYAPPSYSPPSAAYPPYSHFIPSYSPPSAAQPPSAPASLPFTSAPVPPPSPASFLHRRWVPFILGVIAVVAASSATVICWVSRRQFSGDERRVLERSSRSRMYRAVQGFVSDRVTLDSVANSINIERVFVVLLPDIFECIVSENRGGLLFQAAVLSKLTSLLEKLQDFDRELGADLYMHTFKEKFSTVACTRFDVPGARLVGAFYGTLYNEGLFSLSELSTMRFSRINADPTMIAFARGLFEIIQDFREDNVTVLEAMTSVFDDGESSKWTGFFMNMDFTGKATRKFFFIMLCVKGECSMGESVYHMSLI